MLFRPAALLLDGSAAAVAADVADWHDMACDLDFDALPDDADDCDGEEVE